MANDKAAKVSKKSGMKRVRHKAYSYKTKAGKTIRVEAHYERVHESKPKLAHKVKGVKQAAKQEADQDA